MHHIHLLSNGPHSFHRPGAERSGAAHVVKQSYLGPLGGLYSETPVTSRPDGLTDVWFLCFQNLLKKKP